MSTAFDLSMPFSNQTLSDAQWQTYIQGMVANGVTSGLAVAQRGAGANMSVDVGTGNIYVQGTYGQITATKNLTIATADATNPRIDVVVARLVEATPAIVLDVLTGTPAGSPSAPALTQNASLWELPLANVAVAAGAGSIVTANITDKRYWSSGVGAVVVPNVASASTLTLPLSGKMLIVPVTGTTTITAISNGTTGQIVSLRFVSASCQVTSGGTIKLTSNFISTANGVLTLVFDGTNWCEVARTHDVATQVHGLPANVSVLGNRTGSGQFIQHGNDSGANTGTAVTIAHFRDRATTFPVAFSGTPTVVAWGSNSFPTGLLSVSSTGFTARQYDSLGAGSQTAGSFYIAIGS